MCILKNIQVSCFIVILATVGVYAQQDRSSILSIENGLVNNEVTAIHQDRYGFLWFGTRGGLNKYNGYEFQVIRNNSDSKNNLSNQSVEVICEGKNNILWIGTKTGGLNSYDILKDSITTYHAPKAIQIQSIQALVENAEGKLFIGSTHGLYVLFNNRFYNCDIHFRVYSLKADRKGGVWIGSANGLYYYNPTTKNIAYVKVDDKKIGVASIALDEKAQILYLGTWADGFYVFDIVKKTHKQYTNLPYGINNVIRNAVYAVYLDAQNNVWVGTWGAGLNLFNPLTEKFEHYNLNPENNFNKDYDIILSIEQDRYGIIWIGTDGGGVCKINPFKKKFNNISLSSSEIKGLPNSHILAVFNDQKNGLWIGTKGNGIYYSKDFKNFVKKDTELSSWSAREFTLIGKALWVSTSNGIIVYPDYAHSDDNFIYKNEKNNPNSLSGDKVNTIVRDKTGAIWVGTQEQGLDKLIGYKNKKPIFKRYEDKLGESGALQNDRISCMLVDHLNRLWIGTYHGLHLYNRKADNFTVFFQGTNANTSLTNNTILSLAEDKFGNIWAGTQEGINQIKQAKGHIVIKRYFESIGFPNDYIHAILPDERGNIWMSTNSGITKFDQRKNEFVNFDKQDGLAFNSFSENAKFRSENGCFFWGGVQGVVYFFPDSIKRNYQLPPVYFTSLKINNNDITVNKTYDDRKILEEPLFLSKKLILNYKEDIFSISFSSLDFHAPDKNQYIYKLSGFDKDWVIAGTHRTATYTNLPAGKYVFYVKASNSDLIWNNHSSFIEIEILPPPWKTWWAYSFYAGIIGGGLLFSRYITLSRLKLKNNLKIANLNYDKEREIASVKSKVFTNISHEFRTPLTLMIGPLEDLTQDETIKPETKNTIYKIQNQARRVLNLVNQLLDFQKAESNLLTLNAKKENIVAVVKSAYESFKDEALRKKIEYAFYTNADHIDLMLDKNKMENIVYNLLSNAFKFTEPGGAITVSINFLNGINPTCELAVTDNGAGIGVQEQERIFDRFYQSVHAEPGKYMGTGVGLAFVKELVDLHRGEIILESEPGKGSMFKIILPATKESISSINLVSDENANVVPTEVQAVPHQKDEPLLLIVEDNAELNSYLCNVLSKIGHVIGARDGKEGITKAIETMPDIIISDVMMPEVDGFQLCETLKTDKRTSHIPILLLTAKSDDLSHIEGLDHGADNYLSKPFNPQVLISSVNNLIESRRKLKELFTHSLNLEPGKINIISSDEEFISNIIQLIEERMTNIDLSIDDLAKMSNMSKSTFYRKLKALTGMAGSDFIRLIRLKRSAQFLDSGEYTVSQAAYSAGFNDLKHFRTSFKKQFDIAPSEYLKAHKNKLVN